MRKQRGFWRAWDGVVGLCLAAETTLLLMLIAKCNCHWHFWLAEGWQ
jgi:hypothetical protein